MGAGWLRGADGDNGDAKCSAAIAEGRQTVTGRTEHCFGDDDSLTASILVLHIGR